MNGKRMKKKADYTEKFNSFREKTLYKKLTPAEQAYIKHISYQHQFTYQEFRQVVEASRDLTMWGEGSISEWWQESEKEKNRLNQKPKKERLAGLQNHLQQLRQRKKSYAGKEIFRPLQRVAKIVTAEKQDKNIVGMCPVASEKTVCCNLRTIDVVENCTFGCSYCTIQTFYGKDIIIQDQVKEKLDAIEIDPHRFYHFGTGQSSDSLVWGNRNNILSAHCEFARAHPNILMEFKTKSDNISFFLKNNLPANIVCSWSLNTPTVIENEEHFTASLESRINAARQLAGRGIKVAFHFHPMVWYDGWDTDYPRIAGSLMDLFTPAEVLFISFGSVTLIKPVIQKIRDLGNPTKTLQMPFVSDPHNKLTYPDEIKIDMFTRIYQAFEAWHNHTFFYLCMEKAEIWKASFGYVYESNEQFESVFGRQVMRKVHVKDLPSIPA